MVNFKRDHTAMKEPRSVESDNAVREEEYDDIPKTKKLRDRLMRAPTYVPSVILDDETGEEIQFENVARTTVYRMMETVPELEKPFTFYTHAICGKAHLQSMRTVLARARSQADDEGMRLEFFKLFLVALERHEFYDKVTVMRSQHSSLKQRSALNGIIGLLAMKEDADE